MSKAVKLVENYLVEVTYKFEITNVLNRKNDYEFSIIEYGPLNYIESEYKLYVNKEFDGNIYNDFDEKVN